MPETHSRCWRPTTQRISRWPVETCRGGRRHPTQRCRDTAMLQGRRSACVVLRQLQHHSVPLATLTGPAFPSTSSADLALHRGGCTVVATENTVWCVLVVSVLAEVVETTRSLEPQLTPCRRRAWQSRMHRLDPTAGHDNNKIGRNTGWLGKSSCLTRTGSR